IEQLTINGLAGNDTFNVTTTSTATTINGGDGDDSFNVAATGPNAALTLNGDAGNDTFTIATNNLQSPVTVNAGSGNDTLTLNGTAGPDNIIVTATTVQIGASVINYNSPGTDLE